MKRNVLCKEMKKIQHPLALACVAALGATTGALIYQVGVKEMPFMHALPLAPITFCTTFVLMWGFYRIRVFAKPEKGTTEQPPAGDVLKAAPEE